MRGEGKGGGERHDRLPLTLTLSPKGRGEINFDSTERGRFSMVRVDHAAMRNETEFL